MLIRQIIYFVYVNIIVLGMENWFEWFSFQSWKMVLLMELLIIGVFVLVNVINYINDSALAKSMNDQQMKDLETQLLFLQQQN